jgi:hypothetical protein
MVRCFSVAKVSWLLYRRARLEWQVAGDRNAIGADIEHPENEPLCVHFIITVRNRN